MQSEYIYTYTGVKMSPYEPKENDIKIEDIAHALSFMTRANGHLNSFFSVAQHCLNCAHEAELRNLDKKTILACLLHDASEAYISDITRPVKHRLTQYLAIENRLQGTILKAFDADNLTWEQDKAVKEIDDAMLYYEFLHFTNRRIFDFTPEILSEPDFKPYPFSEVEYKFLDFFNELVNENS